MSEQRARVRSSNRSVPLGQWAVSPLSGRTSILLVRFPEVERQPAHDANFQIPEPRRHVQHTRRSADGTDEVRSFEKTAKQAELKSYDFAHLTSHDVSYWEIILRAVRFEASGGRQSPDLFAAVSSGGFIFPALRVNGLSGSALWFGTTLPVRAESPKRRVIKVDRSEWFWPTDQLTEPSFNRSGFRVGAGCSCWRISVAAVLGSAGDFTRRTHTFDS